MDSTPFQHLYHLFMDHLSHLVPRVKVMVEEVLLVRLTTNSAT